MIGGDNESVDGLQALAVIAGGMGAGAINVIAGSGTLLSFPVLLAVGYSPLVANVSNNIGLVPGSFSGVVNTRDNLVGQGGRARRLATATSLGALLGATVLLRLPPGVFKHVVPVLVIIAATLMLVQPKVAARVSASRESRGREAAPEAGGWVLLICFFTGIYGGYFGAAQGIILLATLGVFLPDALARTNALKNVLACTANAMAAILFMIFGHVAWLAVVLVASGSVVGAFIGARLGKRVPVPVLRAFIVLLGYGVALKLIFF